MRKGSGAQLDKQYPREYNIWAMMKQRCNNPKAANYVNYGARGVTVSSDFLKFADFLRILGPAPSARHTLDRIDNSKGYSAENCRWADVETQQNNRTNGRHFEYMGKLLSAPQLSRLSGLPTEVITHRLVNMGMSVEQALASQKMSWVQRPVLQKTLDGCLVQQHASLAEASRYAMEQGWTRAPRWPSQQHKKLLPMSMDDYRKRLHQVLRTHAPLWGFLWEYEAQEA